VSAQRLTVVFLTVNVRELRPNGETLSASLNFTLSFDSRVNS
jgi:hypothetical protein